jgi:prepilin-type N-terminal cleavage/methylation domain-containing protein
MRKRTGTGRGFTLIEMLAVIGIIVLLVTLVFPAIKDALTKAEVIKAQSAISSLSTAFKAYYTEYGKWPINDTTPPPAYNTYIIDANFVALLQGANPNPLPNAKGYFTPTGNSTPVQTLGSATMQGNPRGIHFLDFKAADLDALGNFVDPWKKPYYCRFDFTYTNSVVDPFSMPTTNLSAGFLVWSAGPDGQFDNKGDSINGQVASPFNKDNVKSW